MWLKILTSAKFLKKFSKFSLIGLSLLLIFYSTTLAGKDFASRGPQSVLAQDGNFEDLSSEPITTGGDFNDLSSQSIDTPDNTGSFADLSSSPISSGDNGSFQDLSSTTIYSNTYGNFEDLSSEPISYGNFEPLSSVPLYQQSQPQPVQAPALIDFPLRPQSTGPAQQQTVYPLRPQSGGVTSTGPVSQIQPPPIYQIRSTPQSTGSVSGPLTYTYNYDSHNSVDSHNRSTSTVDSHNRTNIDDHSISGSFNDAHNISGSYNDQRRNDQSQTITAPASQGGAVVGQSMGSNYLYTAPNTGLTYPYPYANPAYMAPMTQQVVTYPMRPVAQYQNPQMVTYGASNSYPVYTTQGAPVYANAPVYTAAPAVVVQDPNVTKAIVYDTQPKVIAAGVTDATNLPKTGLPIAGLGLGALLPIGLKLRKMGKIAYTENALSPNSLWQERQSQLLTA